MKLESQLWKILEIVNQADSQGNPDLLLQICEVWWEMSDKYHNVQGYIDIFTDRPYMKDLIKSDVIEIVGITIINFLYNTEENAEFCKYFRTFSYLLHQAFLIKIKALLKKLPPFNDSNKFVQCLRRTVNIKQSNKFRGLGC